MAQCKQKRKRGRGSISTVFFGHPSWMTSNKTDDDDHANKTRRRPVGGAVSVLSSGGQNYIHP